MPSCVVGKPEIMSQIGSSEPPQPQFHVVLLGQEGFNRRGGGRLAMRFLERVGTFDRPGQAGQNNS